MSNTITHKRLVSALNKAGMIVLQDEYFKNGNHYFATNPKNGNRIEWATQPAFIPATPEKESHYDETKPITMSVCMRHPDTDMMTDLFMDSFRHTISGAVDLLERS